MRRSHREQRLHLLAMAFAGAPFIVGLGALAAEQLAEPGGALETDSTVMRILMLELRAAAAAVRGQVDSAVTMAREAARLDHTLPVEFGPPFIPKPTHELAGEILLAAGRPLDAQREFTKALAAAPGRSRSLIGLARAASRAGDSAVAVAAARELLRNWHEADRSVPERAEMERLVEGGGA
jgi:hypothetical protein